MIEADVSNVSPKALGRGITMIVLVSLERERADIVDRFKAAIRATKEVMIGYYVTGDADFILVITAKDMKDCAAFTRRFFYEDHDIEGLKTMVVMDRVKAGFAFRSLTSRSGSRSIWPPLSALSPRKFQSLVARKNP